MLVETENPTYKRDANSKALINTDNDAFKAYKQKRDEMVKIRQLSADVETLKKEVGELRSLIHHLQGLNNV